MKASIISFLIMILLSNSKVISQSNIEYLKYDTNICVSHDTTPQIFVSKNATFQGGDLLLFRKFVQWNLRDPQEAFDKGYQGKVYIKFVVNWDGYLKDICVSKSSGYKILDDEAIRVIKLSPRWVPARNNDSVCVPQILNFNVEFRQQYQK
jgi:TonB family protein